MLNKWIPLSPRRSRQSEAARQRDNAAGSASRITRAIPESQEIFNQMFGMLGNAIHVECHATGK